MFETLYNRHRQTLFREIKFYMSWNVFKGLFYCKIKNVILDTSENYIVSILSRFLQSLNVSKIFICKKG